ncbi:MAG: DNA gyrase inhibitor YacG [Phycisphaerales bacterium]
MTNRDRHEVEPKRVEQAAQTCRVCAAPCPPAGAPFCSDRCRLADLNKWFRGDYKISRDMKPEDFDELES